MRNTYRILGVDPSTSATGLALLEFSLETKKLLSIETHLINVDYLYKQQYLSPSANSGGTENISKRIELTLKSLEKMIPLYKPDIVYGEIPHITVDHLNNVFPLARLMNELEAIVEGFNYPYRQVPAMIPKQVIGANIRKGKSKDPKQRVYDCVSVIPDITNLININTISPDELDAIIIAWAGYMYTNRQK